MIISKEVIIKPNNHSIYHYLNLGYDAKCKQDLLVRIEDLTLSSRVRVDCECEKCFGVKKLRYQDYIKCLNLNNFYVCEKCKHEKIKITKNERYGDENYTNKDKYKQTMIFLYGCEIPLNNEKIREKKKIRCKCLSQCSIQNIVRQNLKN